MAGTTRRAKSLRLSAPIVEAGLVDDVVAAVDVERFAGDQACGIVGQERGGRPDIVDRDEASRRRFRLRLFQ
jgi:hypothetical protein